MALPEDFLIEVGMIVLLIGPEETLERAQLALGERSTRWILQDPNFTQDEVMVISPHVAGKSIAELNPPVNYGVVLRSIERFDSQIVPQLDFEIHSRDVLQVAGPEVSVREFARAAGHHPKALQQTDMLSLSIGIALGLILGSLTITLPGDWQFNLGLAGGPLVVALMLGHYSHLGGVVGRFPPATQLFLIRLGLSLLLAGAAIHAGSAIESVFSEYGLTLLAMSLSVMGAAVVVGLLAAKIVAPDLLQALATISGGMNATPAYERLSSQADSDVVLVVFTTAYIFAMLLMVMGTEVLITMLR